MRLIQQSKSGRIAASTCIVRSVLPVLTVTLVALSSSTRARADSIPSVLLNVEAMTQAAVTVDSMLTTALGSSPEEVFTLSGGLNSSSFSFSLTGAYSGMPVDLSFVGAFDPALQTESISATGNVGASQWTESGTLYFVDAGGGLTLMTGALYAVVGDPSHPDIEWPEKLQVQTTQTGETDTTISYHIHDSGLSQRTEGGLAVGGPTIEESDIDVKVAKPPQPPLSISLGGEVNVGPSDSSVSVTDLGGGGYLLADASIVPEPSSLFMLGTGLLAMALVMHKRIA